MVGTRFSTCSPGLPLPSAGLPCTGPAAMPGWDTGRAFRPPALALPWPRTGSGRRSGTVSLPSASIRRSSCPPSSSLPPSPSPICSLPRSRSAFGRRRPQGPAGRPASGTPRCPDTPRRGCLPLVASSRARLPVAARLTRALPASHRGTTADRVLRRDRGPVGLRPRRHHPRRAARAHRLVRHLALRQVPRQSRPPTRHHRH